MTIATRALVAASLVLAALCAGCRRAEDSRPGPVTWRDDWAVHPGIALEVDTEGYRYPSAIAFVPNPGPRPQDPLYFVTELEGRVRVVTNDRTVLTFAESFFHRRPIELTGVYPSLELGLAGICLDPEHGYVFVTFVYHDANDVLRNNIVRFTTVPATFSVSPTTSVDFRGLFEGDRSQASHQIGPCQVADGLVYVSVGDGKQQHESQSLGSTLGKILRMTVEGEPVSDNPFFEHDDHAAPADFVWALGLRNPFGLRLFEDTLLAADNGPFVDRVLTLDAGENYLWGESELSVGTRAIVVLAPGTGVAQMDYSPLGSSVPGGPWQGMVFQTISGDTERLRSDNPPHILAIEYDLRARKLLHAPRTFLRYRGDQVQTLTGLALGPDALYFSAIFPNRSGATAVYKTTYDPQRAHPHLLDEDTHLPVVLRDNGCLGCHRYGGQGGATGPGLDRETLLPAIKARLSSDAYRRASEALDALEQEPFASTRAARREVREAAGSDRLRLWVRNHIMEPRFDNPDALMPSLRIPEARATFIAEELVGSPKRTLASRSRRKLDAIVRRHALGVLVGLAIGVLSGAAGVALFAQRRRHRPRL